MPLTFIPFTMIWPSVGFSAWKMSFRSVDFPAPDGPVRKRNSPFFVLKVTSRRTRRP
jgi:hypothetical protein